MSGSRSFRSEELCDIGIEITREGIRLLQKGYNVLRDRYLEHLTTDLTAKPSLTADKDVEKEFELKLKTREHRRFESIKFFGEESFRRGKVDLTNEANTCVLVDALDGSDLYERELGNWCSAAIFFTPSNEAGKRIHAAIVGLPDETIYVADDIDSHGVKVYLPDQRIFSPDEDNPRRGSFEIRDGGQRTLRGMSSVTRLSDASICFYGQKIPNLTITANKAGWRTVRIKDGEKDKLVPRVYNLAGIPMILKLIDKPSETGSGIDLVMELEGQHAHDVVPGAFLAKRAGATVLDLEGKEITYARLEEVILKPNIEKLTYIIASTPQLAAEAAHTFGAQRSPP